MNLQSTFIKRPLRRSTISQRGGILIESLIGMLLLGIVGAGIMHSTARMTVVQHDMAVHTIAINQMRNILMSGVTPAAGSACTAAPTITLPGATQPLRVVVKDCGAAEMKINGVKIGGTVISEQTVSAARPLVFELGSDSSLVRIGGKVNQRNGG